MYRIFSHISRILRLENEPKTRGCALYEGQEYAVSQWEAILGNWVKFMGDDLYASATYMRTCEIV